MIPAGNPTLCPPGFRNQTLEGSRDISPENVPHQPDFPQKTGSPVGMTIVILTNCQSVMFPPPTGI